MIKDMFMCWGLSDISIMYVLIFSIVWRSPAIVMGPPMAGVGATKTIEILGTNLGALVKAWSK